MLAIVLFQNWSKHFTLWQDFDDALRIVMRIVIIVINVNELTHYPGNICIMILSILTAISSTILTPPGCDDFLAANFTLMSNQREELFEIEAELDNEGAKELEVLRDELVEKTKEQIEGTKENIYKELMERGQLYLLYLNHIFSSFTI